MKISFIQFVYYEYLGIMYLSSSLKKYGHEVDIFICQGGSDTGKFVDEIARSRPDVVAFSIMSGSEALALSLARLIKKQLNVYVVFGGPHPTAVPEIIEQEGVDCVCLGEAENSLVEITGILATGCLPEKVAGAWFKIHGTIVKNDMGSLVQNLELLPRPDRALYRGKFRFLRTRRAGFLLGRGCPYQCTFCASPAMKALYQGKGTYVRQRPVPDVIAEMREVMSAYAIRSVYFYDDTLIMNREWVLAFCEAYQREIGLPFSCNIRADLATEEIIAALARAQCRTVSFGIESGNLGLRNTLLKKKVTDGQIIFCAALLKKYGIRFRTFNMLGLPGETLDDSFQTIALNVKIKTDFPWCALYQPLPGTELSEYCRTKGYYEQGAGCTQPSFFKGSVLHLNDFNEIVNLQKLFFYAVKFPRFQGVIRKLIQARPNAGFEALFACAHAWDFLHLELFSVREMISFGVMNIGRYLPGRNKE